MAGLNQAAQHGDIGALYEEIWNNPSVLDVIDDTPFIDSPLHIAARLGHTHFALEIVMMKPSLARKLDNSFHSPMHLAVINGQQKLVKGLLSIEKELVRVKGKEGRTPLHCVGATEGASSLLYQMLSVCPDAIEDLTFRTETVLHLAVKNNHFDAYRVLIDFIEQSGKNEIYMRQDEDGCTALHHATTLRQFEMVRYLYKKHAFRTWNLGVGLKNNSGKTVQDLIEELHQQDAQNPILRELSVGCRWQWQLPGITKAYKLAFQERPEQNLDALLVVLALVMTVTMQIGVTPPGGFWDSDGKRDDGTQYTAGQPIIGTTDPGVHSTMTFFNLLVFMASLNLILLLTPNMPRKFYIRLVLLLFEAFYFVAAGPVMAGPNVGYYAILTAVTLVYIYSYYQFE